MRRETEIKGMTKSDKQKLVQAFRTRPVPLPDADRES